MDQIPHIDGAGGAGYSAFSYSGTSTLENPGFTDAGLWGLIYSAWNSVGYNQMGTWSYLGGAAVSGGVIDVRTQSIVSWIGGAPGDYNTAASIILQEALTSASRNGGLSRTQATSTSQIVQLLSKELGITTNDIFSGGIMLETVTVHDTPDPLTYVGLSLDASTSIAAMEQVMEEIIFGVDPIRKAQLEKVLKKFARVSGVFDMMQHLDGAIDGFSEHGLRSEKGWSNLGKLSVDALVTFGKVNPYVTGAWALYNTWEDISSLYSK